MLVLAREDGESIMIGDNIKITMIVEGGRTKFGIEAPIEIPVHRLEVYEAIKRGEQPPEQNSGDDPK